MKMRLREELPFEGRVRRCTGCWMVVARPHAAVRAFERASVHALGQAAYQCVIDVPHSVFITMWPNIR